MKKILSLVLALMLLLALGVTGCMHGDNMLVQNESEEIHDAPLGMVPEVVQNESEEIQDAPLGMVPEDNNTYDSLESIVNPVEMADWFAGDIQKVWRVGVKASVTDVYTGIVWRAQRIGGDKHADVEPATKEDTKAYCQIYKVKNPSEITDRKEELQSYRPRPLWVTIGNRTFAASLYGVPSNPEDDMIPDNEFIGRVCIHFVNSQMHDSDIVDYDCPADDNFDHQSAIQYAYDKYWNENE